MRPSADRRARERVRGSTVLLLCATASLLLALQAGRASALSMPHTPRRAVLQQLGAAASAVSLGPLLTVAPAATTPQPIVHHYGLHRDQFGELWLPAAAGTSAAPPDRALPVIALLHGGFWQQAYDRRLMDDLAASIARHGRMACWNLEYRRVGQGGAGGRPATFLDVAAGLDWLRSTGARKFNLDPSRVAVAGHSAGGTLAAWAALRPLLPDTASGSPTRDAVLPCAAVSLGGVLDLQWAAQQNTGRGAVSALMASAPPWPDSWCYSPIDMLPPVSASLRRDAQAQGRHLRPPDCLLGLVHAQRDVIVPVEQSIRFTVAACTAGVETELHRIASESHFDCLDPASLSWRTALDLLQRGILRTLERILLFVAPCSVTQHNVKSTVPGVPCMRALGHWRSSCAPSAC